MVLKNSVAMSAILKIAILFCETLVDFGLMPNQASGSNKGNR